MIRSRIELWILLWLCPMIFLMRGVFFFFLSFNAARTGNPRMMWEAWRALEAMQIPILTSHSQSTWCNRVILWRSSQKRLSARERWHCRVFSVLMYIERKTIPNSMLIFYVISAISSSKLSRGWMSEWGLWLTACVPVYYFCMLRSIYNYYLI